MSENQTQEFREIKRFLVVDEDPENTTFFKVLLMEHQIPNVTTTNSPKEALDLLEAKRIQFVIVAREMNEMAGAVFIQKVHGMRQFKFLPCLIFSKQMSEHDIRLAKELGVNVFAKPFNKQEIWDLISAMRKKEEEIDPTELKLRDVETLIAEKQYKVAMHTLKDNLGTGPSAARAHTLLGEVHYKLDELDKSEKSLDQALADKQNYTPAMQMIAKVYSKTERHEKAITMLVQMVDASPKNITTLLGLSSAYNEANQLDNAKATIKKVKELDPTNKAADEELGKIAFKEGNMGLAEQLLAETENAEELGRFFNNLAIGLVSQGKYDEGIRTYEASMNILRGKDSSKMHLLEYNLGLAYRKKGHLDKALEMLAKCYFQNPSFRKPYESIVRIIREMEKKKMPYDKSIVDRIQKLKQAS
jgi:tetratricopeptide (TPR) repeat protein